MLTNKEKNEMKNVLFTGDKIVTELEMEKLIEELEMRCYVKLQQALRTIEGLGIEYDENVVCDICRSVRLLQFFIS